MKFNILICIYIKANLPQRWLGMSSSLFDPTIVNWLKYHENLWKVGISVIIPKYKLNFSQFSVPIESLWQVKRNIDKISLKNCDISNIGFKHTSRHASRDKPIKGGNMDGACFKCTFYILRRVRSKL